MLKLIPFMNGKEQNKSSLISQYALFLKSMFKYRIGELTRPQNVTLVK
jgi:hypothetical protein